MEETSSTKVCPQGQFEEETWGIYQASNFTH
jgi:hypothetical protein